MSRHTGWSLLICICGFLFCFTGTPRAESAKISYNHEAHQLSVKTDGQPLLDVLGQLAARTGWHIFIEPESNPPVHTEFKDVGIGEAIGALVGRMNYAMVPQRDGPTKLFIFRTSRGNATQEISPPPVTAIIRRVGNELIVTVEPGTDIEALAERLGAKIVGQIPGTNTYRLAFKDDEAAESARTQLASTPGVKGVNYNYIVDRPSPSQSIAQGPQPPVQLTLNPPPADGRIVVGLVDTGVQEMGGGLDDFLLPSISVSGESSLSADELSHGTSMAETILRSIAECSGGSTSIQILPVDIYGSNPTATSFDVAMGIAAAVNGGANVINLSLGSYGGASYLQEVIHQASQKGVVLFAAAGNEPVTNPVYPAAYPDVTAVTALQGDQLAPYANRGAFVDMAAPGSSVVYFNGQPYFVNGTSPAAAYTSGLVACLAQRQQISLAQAAAIISQQYSVNFRSRP